ncbi:DNA polymerase IV [Belliella kenyensis]|uniref:DNA polymerase IV n=1 Tax=Belliella kenyensis TaxID=1472724 RepID=A0ABV8ENB4_9BACT|nr:DNA polymerase IV [Belliella kenyensis]MCH7403389.1 DNA polymerase IV [Belliella kenyensis]MDN3601601.1 DNA polymerase IV [Belliella kenyensis]
MGSFRKIIHVDMDAFFASVEQLDNPDLRGKPVAVGGNEVRGVVAAASYEAREYGVRSAMSGKMAALKCPHLIFVKPRFERYKEVSNQIREIFFEYTDLVEPLSLDEAFLDVTENKFGNPSASLLAQEIRDKIKATTGLNASAGISYNKFLAKTASDINKPNGQAVILPKEAEAFLEKMPIEKFFGIGAVTAEKMKKLGIHQGKDLKEYSLQFLTKRFGKSGLHFFNIVRGIHNSEVQPHRERKSLSAESTFENDLLNQDELVSALKKIFQELVRRMERTKIQGRTVTLKIKYKDFSLQTRSKSFEQFPNQDKIWETVIELLNQTPLTMAVRLFGIGVSNLNILEDRALYGKQLWLDFEE